MRWILLTLVVGCGATTQPPPSHQAPPAPKVCLPRRLEHAAISELAVRENRVALCYGEGSEQMCFGIDGRGTLLGEVEPGEQDKPSPPAHTIAWTAGTSYKICAGDRCGSITARHAPNDPHLAEGLVSDDGKRAFVMSVRTVKGAREIWGELLDVPAGRSLAEFRTEFTDTGITRATGIFGDKVAIGVFHAGPCCGTWLFDPRDGKSTYLHGWDGRHLRVDDGTLLALHDHLAQLIDLSTLRTTAALTIPGTPFGEDSPELRSTAMVRLPGGALIAHAQPGGFVLYDATAKALRGARVLPLCD